MASAFVLNGEPCVHISELQSIVSQQSLGPGKPDFSLSDWMGRANSFCHQCGVDPSYGYFVIPYSGYIGQGGLRIKFADDSSQSFDVKIEWARKVTPAKHEADGYYLVRVTDDRYALAVTLVGKRFNLVDTYLHPASGQENGVFKYVKETTKEREASPGETEGQHTPYTWEELFDEVWKLPGGQKLNKEDIEFPEYVPQDVDWRYVTRRDALDALLLWTGTTIEPPDPEDDSGEYKLVDLKDESNARRDKLLDGLDPYVLSNDRFTRYSNASAVAPSKFILHFRQLKPENAEVDEYKKEEKTVAQFQVSKYEVSLRLPSYYVTEPGVPEEQKPSKISDDFLDKTNKYLNLFPPQEKTYRGLHYYSAAPPSNQPSSGGDEELVLRPTAYLAKVIWFDIGDGPKTSIVTAEPRRWIPAPAPIDQLGKNKVNIAVGRAYGQVSSSQTQFIVDDLRKIAGSLGSGKEEGLSIPFPMPPDKSLFDYAERFLLVHNTHRLEYQNDQTITIYHEDGSTHWDTDLTGGTGRQEMYRFELAVDKPWNEPLTLGFLIDLEGVALDIAPDGHAQEIPLIDPHPAKHEGRGGSGGFNGSIGSRGWCVEHLHAELGPVYAIISIDSPARWIEGTLVEKWPVNRSSCGVLVIDYWGAAPNHLPPKASGTEGAPVVITIFDTIGLREVELGPGVPVRAVYNEKVQLYLLQEVRVFKDKKPPVRELSYAIITGSVPGAKITIPEAEPGGGGETGEGVEDPLVGGVGGDAWIQNAECDLGQGTLVFAKGQHMPAVNLSTTPFEVMEGFGVAVAGEIFTCAKPEGEEEEGEEEEPPLEFFVIHSVFDLRAVPGWDPSKITWPGFAGKSTAEHKRIPEWLELLEGFSKGQDQSIGHDDGVPPKWQDDGDCEEESPGA